MSNNSNYIQSVENIQQISKKYYSYLYEIRHIPTGYLYVGSRSKQSALKKFEDCYTDKYLGSSSLKEGPFSKIDIKINPQDYQKTVLKVFYSEDQKIACKNEHGENGLIMTYWTMYGKDKVLNKSCILNDGSRVFSSAGQNTYANKTEEEMAVIKQKLSESHKGENNPMFGKNVYANKTEDEMLIIREKMSQNHGRWNKGKKMPDQIKQKITDSSKKYWQNLDEEKKEFWSKKFAGENNPMYGKNAYENKTEDEMLSIRKKISDKVKDIPYRKYKCPYDDSVRNYKGFKNISNYIKENYPDKKQWFEYTKEEKEMYLIKN